MEHARLLFPTRKRSTRKLLPCGIESVMSQLYCKEAFLRDAQSVSLGALVAPACPFSKQLIPRQNMTPCFHICLSFIVAHAT